MSSCVERIAIAAAASTDAVDATNTVDWALVSSVVAADITDVQINEFAAWYSTAINGVSAEHRRDILLSATPAFICRVPSGEKELCQRAYRDIHTLHPEIAIVIHLLPTHNTKDFLWMKELSEVYGLVRQGIQSSNVASRFADCKPSQPAALNNMSSWLSHRVHNLAVGELKNQGVHVRISVENEYCGRTDEARAGSPGSGDKENEPAQTLDRRSSVVVPTSDAKPLDTNVEMNYSLNVTDMTQAVWMSLHGYQNAVRPLFASHDYNEYAKCRSDAWVEIRGLPSETIEWDVAGFLHEYNVRSVYFTTKHGMSVKRIARVCLGSRWEAVHCIERQTQLKYHERYPVVIEGVHDRTLDVVGAAVAYDGATRAYKQFSSKQLFNEAQKQ